MPWYFYIAHFVAGLFLANSIPHFVNGISGRRFVSPFGKPPGRGESSAVSNVVWGGANMVVGFGLLWLWPMAMPFEGWDVIAFAAGFFLAAVGLAQGFQPAADVAPQRPSSFPCGARSTSAAAALPLTTPGTGRNWTTITKLLAIAEAMNSQSAAATIRSRGAESVPREHNGDVVMAKGDQKPNKEKRKPKADKNKPKKGQTPQPGSAAGVKK